jgi:MFS family permease
MNTAVLAAGNGGAGEKRSFREVWLITLGHAMTHWYPSTFYLLLPIIGNELGLSFSQIGLIMTCQYIASAVANFPGGMLVDTVGRKGLLMAISLFWVGFPYFVMGFVHSYWLLLACVIMVGAGNSLWHPTAIPTLASNFPERKGLVLSLHGMGGNAGDAIAPLVVGALLTVFTWRTVVMLNVIPGVTMALMMLAFLGTLRVTGKKGKKGGAAADGKTQTLAEYFRGLRELMRHRGLVVLCASGAFRSMTQNALLTFLPLYLVRVMGFETFWVGACMFVLQAAGFAAAPVAGHLSDRMGRRSVVMSSMAMTAVVLLAMAFVGHSIYFIMLIAVLGFFLYALRPVLQAWLLESTPKNMGGSSIGVLFATQSLGSSIAPLIGGLVADRHGIQGTFYFLAGTIVCANLLILLMPRAEEKA